MGIYFKNDRRCNLYCLGHNLKYKILWIVLLIFQLFSVYFLLPEKTIDHDRGSISSELTKVQTEKDDIIRIDYVNSAGEITYAIDKQLATLIRTIDAEGRCIEEHYFDEKEKPTECYGYFGISYIHKEKLDIITYLDSMGKPIKTASGYSIVVRSFNGKGQDLDDMYYDADMNPQMCNNGYYGIHREYNKKGLVDEIVYLNEKGYPVCNTSGVAREKYILDSKGRIEKIFFFDLENNPFYLQLGQAGEEYTYDEDSRIKQIIYLDQDGNPSKTTQGYTILKKSYYKDGSEKSNMYFDFSENQVALDKGQYGIVYVGNSSLYLNKNGHVMLCVDNLLNGYPFMVVVIGVLLCIGFCFFSRKFGIFMLLMYAVFIFYETLMFRETGDTRVNFVLFSYADVFFTNWRVRTDTINNIWLFVPFGTGLYVIFRNKKVWIVALILSMTIEMIQYFTGLGIAEADDLFGNTLGGVIGMCIGIIIFYEIKGRRRIEDDPVC